MGKQGASAKPHLARAAVALGILTAGCAQLHTPSQRAGDDPFDQIHEAPHATAGAAGRSTSPLPSSAYHPRWWFQARPPRPRPLPPQDKIHPDLRRWLRTRPGTDVEELVVTFRDTVAIPRFPKVDLSQPRTNIVNENAANAAKAMIDTLVSHRRAQYDADSLMLTGYQAQLRDKFWLIQAMVVSMPLGLVDSLSRRPDVVYIRSNVGDGPPHHDSNLRNDPIAARVRIGSEHYSGLGMGNGWIALLDTGVRTSHWMLCGPSHLCLVANCEAGDCNPPYSGTNCSSSTGLCPPDAGGDMDVDGHGTSSAAILVGNDRLKVGLRGVTEGELDCFTVYGTDDRVRVGATVKGFEYAIARLNQVIVAEMQDNTATDIADVSAAADHAYDAGALVIAANGNYSYWGSGEPARSRRAIGVGAYYIDGEVDIAGAWGLTVDERIKPDIKAPSYTETASNKGDDLTQYFGGTSGATPYAAGATSLLRNWMAVGLAGIDPGQVFGNVILCGDQVSPFDGTSSSGAGKIQLPQTGTSWWGKVWVSNSVEYVEIPIDVVDTGKMSVQAAIWWPEEPVSAGGVPLDGHNDIDLQLRGPKGKKVVGESRYGVFERVAWEGVATGRWRVRLKPFTMRKQPQVVYWGVSAVPTP